MWGSCHLARLGIYGTSREKNFVLDKFLQWFYIGLLSLLTTDLDFQVQLIAYASSLNQLYS